MTTLPPETAIGDAEVGGGIRPVAVPLLSAAVIALALWLGFRPYADPTLPFWRDGYPVLSRIVVENAYCRTLLFVGIAGLVYAGIQIGTIWAESALFHRALRRPGESSPAAMRWLKLVGRERTHVPRLLLRLPRAGRSMAGPGTDGADATSMRSRPDDRVDAAMARQAIDLRAARLRDALLPLEVMVWALPLLGFIGTVIGITGSIAGLQPVLEAIATGTGGGASIGPVLAQLSFAFDTTLVGLVLVLPINLMAVLVRLKSAALDHDILAHALPRPAEEAAEGGA